MLVERNWLVPFITLIVSYVHSEVFFGKLALKTPTTGKRHSIFESHPFVFATRRSTYLKKNGDVFKVHLPGIAEGVPNKNTVSFESMRFPGYFLAHDTDGGKNLFKIAKKIIPENPSDKLFDNSATFFVDRRAGIEGSGMLRLFSTPQKYLCVGKENFAVSALQSLENDHKNEVDFKHRCSFFIQKLKEEKVQEAIKRSMEEVNNNPKSASSDASPQKSNVPPIKAKMNKTSGNRDTDSTINKMLLEFSKKIEKHQKYLSESGKKKTDTQHFPEIGNKKELQPQPDKIQHLQQNSARPQQVQQHLQPQPVVNSHANSQNQQRPNKQQQQTQASNQQPAKGGDPNTLYIPNQQQVQPSTKKVKQLQNQQSTQREIVGNNRQTNNVQYMLQPQRDKVKHLQPEPVVNPHTNYQKQQGFKNRQQLTQTVNQQSAKGGDPNTLYIPNQQQVQPSIKKVKPLQNQQPNQRETIVNKQVSEKAKTLKQSSQKKITEQVEQVNAPNGYQLFSGYPMRSPFIYPLIYGNAYNNMYTPNVYGSFYNPPLNLYGGSNDKETSSDVQVHNKPTRPREQKQLQPPQQQASNKQVQKLLPLKQTNKGLKDLSKTASKPKQTDKSGAQTNSPKPNVVAHSKWMEQYDDGRSSEGRKNNIKVIGPKKPINLHNFTVTHNHREPSLNLDGLMTGVKIPVARSQINVENSSKNSTATESYLPTTSPTFSSTDGKNIFYIVQNITGKAKIIENQSRNNTQKPDVISKKNETASSDNITDSGNSTQETTSINGTMSVNTTDSKLASMNVTNVGGNSTLINSTILGDKSITFDGTNNTANQTNEIINATLAEDNSKWNKTFSLNNTFSTLNQAKNELSGSKKNSVVNMKNVTVNGTTNVANISSPIVTNTSVAATNLTSHNATDGILPVSNATLLLNLTAPNNENTTLLNDTSKNGKHEKPSKKANLKQMTDEKPLNSLNSSSLNLNNTKEIASNKTKLTANNKTVDSAKVSGKKNGQSTPSILSNNTIAQKKDAKQPVNTTVAVNTNNQLRSKNNSTFIDKGDTPQVQSILNDDTIEHELNSQALIEKAAKAPEEILENTMHMSPTQNIQRDSKENTVTLLNSAFPHPKIIQSDVYLNPENNGPLRELPIGSNEYKLPASANFSSPRSQWISGNTEEPLENLDALKEESNFVYNNNRKIGTVGDVDKIEMNGISNAMHKIDNSDIAKIKNEMNHLESQERLGPMSIKEELQSQGRNTLMGVGEPREWSKLDNVTNVDGNEQAEYLNATTAVQPEDVFTGTRNNTVLGLTNYNTLQGVDNGDTRSHLYLNTINTPYVKGVARDNVVPPYGDNNYHGRFHQGANYDEGRHHFNGNIGYLEDDPMSPPNDNAHVHHYDNYHSGDNHLVDNHHYHNIHQFENTHVPVNDLNDFPTSNPDPIHHEYFDNNENIYSSLHEPEHHYDDSGIVNKEAINELNGDHGFTHHNEHETHPIIGSPNSHATTLYETEHYVPAQSNNQYITGDVPDHPEGMTDETNVVHHTHHVVTVKSEAEKQKMVHGLVNSVTDKCVSLQIINDINRRYRLISSINKHGYTPRGKLFTLKTVFKDPSAHRVVIFEAINELDPGDVLLINGKRKLLTYPTSCDEQGKIVHVTHVNQHPSVVGCGSSGDKNCATNKDVIARTPYASNYGKPLPYDKSRLYHANYNNRRSVIQARPPWYATNYDYQNSLLDKSKSYPTNYNSRRSFYEKPTQFAINYNNRIPGINKSPLYKRNFESQRSEYGTVNVKPQSYKANNIYGSSLYKNPKPFDYRQYQLYLMKRNEVKKRNTGCTPAFGGSTSGSPSCCVFPFTFNGQVHTKCIEGDGERKSWCGLTDNVDRDKRWGMCTIPTIPDTNENQQYRCPLYCAQQCLPSCPAMCCFRGK